MPSPSLYERYGPTALVTGASSGIGEQFARCLAQEGFNLLLAARRVSRLSQLAQELEQQHGIGVQWQVCDLATACDVDALIQRARECEVSLIVSNAGFGVAKGEFTSVEQAALEEMYATNSTAPARILRELVPDLLAQGKGGVICTGSMEGDAPFPYSTAYAASKAFLHSLVHGLWYELRDTPVDVLLLAPGSTDTEAPIMQGISRDQLVGVMSPERVVRQALGQLGRQPHFIPGMHNRMFVRLLCWLPRRWAIALAGMGMKQAIEKSAVSR